MARVLIVGCGGRGQALARSLVEAGHAVRGTTRDAGRVDAIAAAGAEPYVGDPDRIGTLMGALHGVTVVMWLLGSASGERAEELHAGRLRMLCEKLVDTPVRGLVYETGGVDRQEGLAAAIRVSATYSMPVEILDADPAEHDGWTAAAAAAVQRVLSA